MAIEKVRRLGVYAPLSATYYEDDDIADAGEAAELLYVRGLAFSARRPADGFISETQVVRFVGVGMSDALERAETLVKVGLWERVDGGFVVRSWLKWNKSAEELGQDLSKDRDRKRKQSEARADAALLGLHDPDDDAGNPGEPDTGGGEDSDNATTNDSNGIREVSARNPQESLPNTLHSTTPHNTSLHTPLSAESESEDGALISLDATAVVAKEPKRRRIVDTPEFAQFWKAYPRPVDKGHARIAWQKMIDSGVDPHEMIQAAIFFRNDPKRERRERFLPHPATWLNGERWTDGETAPPPAQTNAHARPWEN